MEKDIIKDIYDEILPLYIRAGQNISEAIEILMNEHKVSFLAISHRIKEFESFFEKINRKKYKNPFEQNEDFCGIRIVIYYIEDIPKIERIIETEFILKTKESKEDILSVNEFGYRSYHYIFNLKESWLETPNFKGLKDIKIELQVRTALMHAWAEIEHKLGYKNKDQIPNALKRKLSIVSAKLEEADNQFQETRNSAEDYKIKLIKQAETTGKFISTEFNIDTFQALLDFYFPGYVKHDHMLKSLYSTINNQKIPIELLVEYAEKTKPFAEFINSNIYGGKNKKTTQSNLMSYSIESFSKNYDIKYCSESRKKLIVEIRKKAQIIE